MPRHKKNFARTFGQDLMRGEHIVGGGKLSKAKNLTWVAGERPTENLDPTSRKNLAGGRRNGLGRAIATQEWVNGKISEGEITGGMSGNQTGTSIFDPVLCELAYRWFCPPQGVVLDPFAGGSVRGIVASKLGRQYHGVDLRSEQVTANATQAKAICTDPIPNWVVGDSRNVDALLPGVGADFIFSCPPYADLEVYSDNPLDLSTMGYTAFREAYGAIVKASCALLKPDRFACFVIGDARDKDGMYYGLPAHTMEAFVAAGLRLYNEMILITAAGSLPIRTGKQFSASRKVGKTHQNVYVFVKGNPVKATKAIGTVEFASFDPAPAVNGSGLLQTFGKEL